MAAGSGVQCARVRAAVSARRGAGRVASAGEGDVHGESGADARGGGVVRVWCGGRRVGDNAPYRNGAAWILARLWRRWVLRRYGGGADAQKRVPHTTPFQVSRLQSLVLTCLSSPISRPHMSFVLILVALFALVAWRSWAGLLAGGMTNAAGLGFALAGAAVTLAGKASGTSD